MSLSLAPLGSPPTHALFHTHTHTHLQIKRRESCPFSKARVTSLMPMQRHFLAYL